MKKYIGLTTLVLLQIVIVGNLQILPITAQYGFSLPFFVLLAALGFLLPCIFMTSELTTRYPQTGGAYLWSEHAFGKSAGFFTATTLWLSNLLWYPVIFSLIATSLCYVYTPEIATNKSLVISLSVGFFWLITLLNLTGVQFSSRFSSICAIIGILFPILIIIIGGLFWLFSKQPIAINTQTTPLLPNLSNMTNIGMLISVTTLFFGLEMTAAHAGNVENPQRNFPRSVLISGALLVVIMLAASLAISIIVPHNQLSNVSGLLDAMQLLFQYLHAMAWFKPMCLLIFIGNLGSVSAWMLSATRSMWVASCQNELPYFFKKINRYQAPSGILIIEACVFSLAMSVFLILPHLNDSYWLLLDLASQLTLVYYVVLFVAAIYLHIQFKKRKPNHIFILLMFLGVITCLSSFFIGFIPPPNLTDHDLTLFTEITRTGMIFALLAPFALLIL